jgi:uncharacterized membrane protein YfcA
LTAALAAAAAFALALVTTPVGISGAVFLLPIQVSLLGVPSPSVTPTNLLYNVFATPGGVWRYWRTGRLSAGLARVLVLGTLPGVVLGAVVRVEVVPGSRAFLAIVACVLGPLGAWLAFGPSAAARSSGDPPRPTVALAALAFAVGVVGGIYGIGGGSIIAPILLLLGYSVTEFAGAALLATLLTSIAGIATFELLAAQHGGGTPIGPDWTVGVSAGIGGLVGSYTGARLQPRLPERALRRLLGLLALGIALRYVWVVLGG